MKKLHRVRRLSIDQLESHKMLAPLGPGSIYDVIYDPTGGTTLAEFDNRVVSFGIKLTGDPTIGAPNATVTVAFDVSPQFANDPASVTFKG